MISAIPSKSIRQTNPLRFGWMTPMKNKTSVQLYHTKGKISMQSLLRLLGSPALFIQSLLQQRNLAYGYRINHVINLPLVGVYVRGRRARVGVACEPARQD